MGRDSSVGIATRCGLDGPRIESRWGRDFPHPSRSALGPTQPPIQLVLGPSPGGKVAGRGVDHPPPSSAEVKERVKLYLYSPPGPSWPVLGRTLPSLFTFNKATVFLLVTCHFFSLFSTCSYKFGTSSFKLKKYWFLALQSNSGL